MIGAPVVLDERLSAVAGLFPVCARGADIGADHGKLAARLLQEGKCGAMLLSDISGVSLSKARRLFDRLGLLDKAVFAVADGFDALTAPVDCAAVCGMGSRTICGMIERRPELPGHPVLLISAQTELPRLRQTLVTFGYDIELEHLVRSGGRYYIIIKAVWRQAALTDREIFLGRNLAADDGTLLISYYRWLLALEEKKKHRDERGIAWLKEALADA